MRIIDMNEKNVIIIGICGTVLMIAALTAIIVYICTYHSRIYKSLKKPVKTMGEIISAEWVRGYESYSDGYETPGHYIITCSFTDNTGQPRSVSFQCGRNIGKAGDKIVLHYDSEDPQKFIADCQLKYGKSLWWKVLIVLAVLFVPAIIIAFNFG